MIIIKPEFAGVLNLDVVEGVLDDHVVLDDLYDIGAFINSVKEIGSPPFSKEVQFLDGILKNLYSLRGPEPDVNVLNGVYDAEKMVLIVDYASLLQAIDDGEVGFLKDGSAFLCDVLDGREEENLVFEDMESRVDSTLLPTDVEELKKKKIQIEEAVLLKKVQELIENTKELSDIGIQCISHYDWHEDPLGTPIFPIPKNEIFHINGVAFEVRLSCIQGAGYGLFVHSAIESGVTILHYGGPKIHLTTNF
ncbi:hypothetical protein L7F22_046393 [Adiantum nelumboides]|nr:hypothetical protein [Adiantum nelumboides]